MDIRAAIEKIRTLEDCIVYPPKGIPIINKANILPNEIYEFYSICGGIDLFINSEKFPYKIVPPEKFILAIK